MEKALILIIWIWVHIDIIQSKKWRPWWKSGTRSHTKGHLCKNITGTGTFPESNTRNLNPYSPGYQTNKLASGNRHVSQPHAVSPNTIGGSTCNIVWTIAGLRTHRTKRVPVFMVDADVVGGTRGFLGRSGLFKPVRHSRNSEVGSAGFRSFYTYIASPVLHLRERGRRQRRDSKAFHQLSCVRTSMAFVSFVGRVLFASVFILSAWQEWVFFFPSFISLFESDLYVCVKICFFFPSCLLLLLLFLVFWFE